MEDRHGSTLGKQDVQDTAVNMKTTSTVPKNFDARKWKRTKLYFESKNHDTGWTCQIRKSKSERWQFVLYVYDADGNLRATQQSNDEDHLQKLSVNLPDIF